MTLLEFKVKNQNKMCVFIRAFYLKLIRKLNINFIKKKIENKKSERILHAGITVV